MTADELRGQAIALAQQVATTRIHRGGVGVVPIITITGPRATEIASALDEGADAIRQLDRLLAALKLAEPFLDTPRDRDDLQQWEAMRNAVTSAIAEACGGR